MTDTSAHHSHEKEARTSRCNVTSKNTLDFSFKSLLTSKYIEDEISKGEIENIKRSPESGKLICTALRMSNNNLTDLQDFRETIETVFHDSDSIEWIDLSFNDIHTIDSVLSEFKNLKVLYLHANVIEKFQEINKLAALTQLKSLTLHGNPIESEKGYRQYIISLLPGLKTLDFSGVTKQDRSTAETWKKMNPNTKRKRKKD